MITIIGWSLLYPSKIPAAEPSVSLLRKIRASGHLIPIVLLIIGVIGSIYVGIDTATEAAAVGVAGALLLSAVTGSLNWESFRASLFGATITHCMISTIGRASCGENVWQDG